MALPAGDARLEAFLQQGSRYTGVHYVDVIKQ